jgi:hypothetical protein
MMYTRIVVTMMKTSRKRVLRVVKIKRMVMVMMMRMYNSPKHLSFHVLV